MIMIKTIGFVTCILVCKYTLIEHTLAFVAMHNSTVTRATGATTDVIVIKRIVFIAVSLYA